MKTNKRVMGITLLASALLISNGYAANNTQQVNPMGNDSALNVGLGNNFEKEVTPLLREISKKRSALQIRQLDRELEKLDEDAGKAQLEKEKLEKALSAPTSLVSPQQNQSLIPTAPVNQANAVSELRVIMVYGSDSDLYAKVAMGNEGGYPVRKGDILPDGRVVHAVYPNYIEVKKMIGKKLTVERVFVTGNVTPPASTTPTNGVPMGMPLSPGSIIPPQNNVIYIPPAPAQLQIKK